MEGGEWEEGLEWRIRGYGVKEVHVQADGTVRIRQDRRVT